MGHGLCNVVTRSSLFSKPTSSASLIMEESKKIIKVLNPVISDLRGVSIDFHHSDISFIYEKYKEMCSII